MGLFGKKKNEENKETNKSEALVAPVDSSNEELQDLLKEFRSMRAGLNTEEVVEEEVHDAEHLNESGEEYEITEDDSKSIESFLSGEEEVEDEEIIEDEEIEDEPITEEELDEEVIEDEEAIEDEEIIEDEPVDVEVSIHDYKGEEEVEEESEEVDYDDIEEDVSEDYYYEEEEPEAETIYEPESEPVVPVDAVTNEELDKKFNEFESRLIDKLMQQFSLMQMSQPASVQTPVVPEVEVKTAPVADDDELDIKTVNGKLTINGFVFSGEVVMFTPLESVKKASWEEVVRRKGHCTYHLTTSGNGGWFIKKSNAPNPYAYIEKKEEAEELAKTYAKREKAELKIHNAKGVIEKSLSYGREKLRG